MMRKKDIKIFAAVSSAVMALSFQSTLLTAHGEHVQKIVVLGDSISTGKDLAPDEKSYVTLLEEYTNIQIQNFAQDNYTTADVLNCLSDAQVKNALAQADVILITVGEHDFMDEFLVTADNFRQEFQFEKFHDVFSAQLTDYGFTDENELIPYSNTLASKIRQNQNTVSENIQQINSELANYPNAKIIYQNAYNLLDNLHDYDTLSSKRQMAYNGIMNPAKTTLTKYLNDYITQFAEEHENCILIDTYTGFAGNAYQYTRLYELNMNPTAAGHQWMADTIIKESGLSRMGDVNADDEVNASDAAAILEHAAAVGAGRNAMFNADQLKGADVDENGSANSEDAAQVLRYAAAEGSGKRYLFQKSDSIRFSDAVLADPDPTQPTDTELADPDPIQPTDTELADPDPTQPTDTELADPDPTQPTDTELAAPDPTQPTDTELADPDPFQPEV